MLSPFLFSIYVGELVTMLDEADCRGVYLNEEVDNIVALLFADDVVAGADSVGRLQRMIDVIATFCDKWGLVVNLSKTKVMVFRNGGPLRHNERWFLNGNILEVVSSYKYLGSLFTPRLVWSLSQSTLATQSRRGLFLLTKYDYSCGGLPVDVQLELFEKLITPILLYSSEVWGFNVASSIEKVQTDFCKYILGVPSHTPNIAVLGETGRLPMYVLYFKKCVKFWLKILSMPSYRYPRASYGMLLSLDNLGRQTWATSVKNLLYKYGFQHVWDQQGVGNEAVFLREFVNRVSQSYMEEWEFDMSQSSKLSLLRSLKPFGICRESYLVNVTFRKYRSGLSKLRCSAHTLRIEKGRHVNELMADRVCKLCLRDNSYVLEDEYHFLLCCPSFSNLRLTYLAEWIVPEPSYDRFLSLLTDESLEVQRNLSTFIYHASKLRNYTMTNTDLNN
jgi:hypothetical protein